MAFDSFLHWLEKRRDENLAADEQPDEVTSEGGVKLPPISGGVPSGE